MHPFKHFKTITRHRHMVMLYCFKCGLIKQGLLHDLSKYGWTEFSNGAKYYLGTKSPHHKEREIKGYSDAWMHHKGRNKHHVEYWVDVNLETKKYEPVEMPFNYVAESVCDRIAASKNYNRDNFKPSMVLDYFNKESVNLPMHENTRKLMKELLTIYAEKGEDYCFKYIKQEWKKIRKEQKKK